MQELKDVRDAAMELVRSHYSQTVFDLWFSDLTLSSLDDKTAVFSIKSDFKQTIVQNKYASVISDALKEVLGFSVDVEIVSTEKSEGFSRPGFTDRVASSLSEQEKTAPAPRPEKQDIGADIESKNVFSQYTFENFIVGDSNKFAQAACIAVARNPATNYNPLFIYGQSGLGKTHLLYAITNEIKRTMPDVRIVYKKGDEFTNELIRAIQNGTTEAFREKYRHADVLLIDDIQFIAGRESTQEEFFHTFNALYDDDKQIILTSDRPPKDIKTLEDRLRTRFEWGLVADVQPPSIELRTAIILKKAEDLGIEIPDDALRYLSENLRNSIRTIEGAIKKISAIHLLNGTPITLDMCKSAVSSIVNGQQSETEVIDRIFRAVSRRTDVTPDEMRGKKRNDNIAKARHMCIYLIRQMTELSLSDIGKIFSRDHATVIASIKYIEGQIESVAGTESEVSALMSEIRAG